MIRYSPTSNMAEETQESSRNLHEPVAEQASLSDCIAAYFAMDHSEETLPHDDNRYDYMSRHHNPHFSSSPEDALDPDVEKDAASRSDEGPPLKEQPPPESNIVDWDGPDDPEKPMNWSNKKKWAATMILSSLTLTITFASSVFSTATMVTAKEFGTSNEVMTLGTSLFVLVCWLALPPLWICILDKWTNFARALPSVRWFGGKSILTPLFILSLI